MIQICQSSCQEHILNLDLGLTSLVSGVWVLFLLVMPGVLVRCVCVCVCGVPPAFILPLLILILSEGFPSFLPFMGWSVVVLWSKPPTVLYILVYSPCFCM